MLPVSAIIPTYNRAHLIERAVRSALAAIRPDDEIIVVDDGSRDRTEEMLKPYGHLIRYIRTENRGAGAARNRGVAEASRPLVAFLDSDDEWLPWRIELGRKLLERRPEVLFTFSNFRAQYGNRILPNGLSFGVPGVRAWEEHFRRGVPYSTLAKLPAGWADFRCHIHDFSAAEFAGGGVCTITLTVRREEAGEDLHFPEDLPTYEDWWCYSRLARRGLGAYLDCETAINYEDGGPRLTGVDSLGKATTRLRMLEEIWGRDSRFLAENRDSYERLLGEYKVMRVKGLLRKGNVRQARAELRELDYAPKAYRTLALLPGRLVTTLLAIRQGLQRTVTLKKKRTRNGEFRN